MLDKIEITVVAGDGGNGAISFRREKFVAYGGPDGGDGGNGGSVILRADLSVSTFRKFQHRRFFRAAKGRDGQGKKKHGRDGEDLIITVPPGTVASYKTEDGEALIEDLRESGQQVLVARGGKGGWGNTQFTSPTNQAPQFAQKGEAGEQKPIVLEMRLIADVGIIGYPNVGKSTFLSAVSAAHPKIADYPFTTLEPVLGVVDLGQQRFTLAEIPGLVEDAHLGRGLGHDFLRHAMRTKMFIHLLDASSASAVEDMRRVNKELALFDPSLEKKPQLVVVNKVDLPEVRARLDELKREFVMKGVKAYFISAATGEGVPELMGEIAQMLSRLAEKKHPEVRLKVFRPQPRAARVGVHKDGDTFVISGAGLERVMTRGAAGGEVVGQLRRFLARKGVDRALEKAGVKPGDKVRCGSLEWEW